MLRRLNDENIDRLFRAILTLETVEECYDFFEDICTVDEVREIARRLCAAKLLREGTLYSEITGRTGLSTATISRVNRSMKYGNGRIRSGARPHGRDGKCGKTGGRRNAGGRQMKARGKDAPGTREEAGLYSAVAPVYDRLGEHISYVDYADFIAANADEMGIPGDSLGFDAGLRNRGPHLSSHRKGLRHDRRGRFPRDAVALLSGCRRRGRGNGILFLLQDLPCSLPEL